RACCAGTCACVQAGATTPTPRFCRRSLQRPEQSPDRVTSKGVGARLPRKEDRRFLRGEGEYVANIRLPGMLDVAFVRSPMAHARIKGIKKLEGVYTSDDLKDVQPIRAHTTLKGFKPSDQYVLAKDKVRQVGELVA